MFEARGSRRPFENLRPHKESVSSPESIEQGCREFRYLVVTLQREEYPQFSRNPRKTEQAKARKIFKNLKDALNDSHHIFATSSRKRTITWPTYSPKEAALEIDTKLKESQKISIVFGREDRGLTNEELELANSLIEIPANPEYPVLNLAMSVQVIAYEIFQSLDFNEQIEWRDSPLATSDEVQHLITHFIDTAESIDVIDKSNPGKIIKRMHRMFTRLQPDKMETNFLRGFLAAINKQKK